MLMKISLRKKCLYLQFVWSVFYRTQTEYKDLLCKSPYSFQILEIKDLKTSEQKHFLHIFDLKIILLC